MVETDVRYKDQTWWHVFSFSILWCDQCLGISLMIDVRLYVNPAFGWKDWNRRSAMNLPMWRTFVVPKQDFCVMCQLKFLCFCLPFHLFQKPTQYVCRAFLVISASKLGTILLYIYIRIIKNLSLSPRRMLISHWSLESIWTPKTSKPCLKPEDKHVQSRGVRFSEWMVTKSFPITSTRNCFPALGKPSWEKTQQTWHIDLILHAQRPCWKLLPAWQAIQLH